MIERGRERAACRLFSANCFCFFF